MPHKQGSSPQHWLYEDRLSLLLIAICYPLWGLLFQWFEFSDSSSSLIQRFTIGSIALVFFGASWISKRTRHHLSLLASTTGFITTAHFFYLSYLNEMIQAYLIGSLILVFSISALIHHPRHLQIYSFFTLFCAWQASSGSHSTHPISFVVAIGTALIVTYLSTHRRLMNLQREIEAKKIIEAQKVQLTSASKLSSLGELAGGVAHELNTPLATVTLLSHQLEESLRKEEVDSSKLLKMVSVLSTTTARIAAIVESLRLFAKDASEDPTEIIVMSQLLQKTLIFCEEKFKYQGIHIQVHQDPSNLCFRGQSIPMSQVLLSLLNNSYDSIKKLDTKWIQIDICQDRDQLKIQITDSGSQLPLKIQQKLFQPFFTTKSLGEGTGISLSRAYGLVQTHGGSLDYENNAGHTSFVIRLPLFTETKSSLAA